MSVPKTFMVNGTWIDWFRGKKISSLFIMCRKKGAIYHWIKKLYKMYFHHSFMSSFCIFLRRKNLSSIIFGLRTSLPVLSIRMIFLAKKKYQNDIFTWCERMWTLVFRDKFCSSTDYVMQVFYTSRWVWHWFL